jgi:hypothetical protein
MKRSAKEDDFPRTKSELWKTTRNYSQTRNTLSTNLSDDKYYKTVKSILQQSDMYTKMIFNNNTYSIPKADLKYVLKDRKKTVLEYDLNVHKKSIQFEQQFIRPENNYTTTKYFDKQAYLDYYINKSDNTLPSIMKIKDNDRERINFLKHCKESKSTAKKYKDREHHSIVFNPPPKFNELRLEEKNYISNKNNDNAISSNNHNNPYININFNYTNNNTNDADVEASPSNEKNYSPKKNQNKSTKFGYDIFRSDVFNFKKQYSSEFLKKSGEKTVLLPPTKFYTSNSMSNSVWIPSHSNPSLFNHTNNEYHILNPSIKTISPLKSKIITSDNKDIITHRQKSFSEFVDITRNGSPNPNKDFVNIYKKTLKPFNKTKNLCSEYALMSHTNKDMCGPIFTTKK